MALIKGVTYGKNCRGIAFFKDPVNIKQDANLKFGMKFAAQK